MKAKDDPIFQDIPWEFIFDEHGELIGEVYLALPDPPTRKRKGKHKLWEANGNEVGSF
ncbi:hypothetical protein RJP21_29785 [Paenibacillus sp. VCA1]|uniref:hypothetical protein n=1 Tax=Paenibacillus sp. VCA1 TaxID=3039148 RepID=UPI0028727B8C|nr:hypothetical protein [Paenibacillus sp. VCA1]MDR9857787.1 hypothetical protein [Paenibacillus sp. VCA1]